MPFGFKTIGATYLHEMTTIFHDMVHDYTEDYIDDTVVKFEEVSLHIGNLKRAF